MNESEIDTIKEIPKNTRFRAYQIGTAGSSYSYYSGSSMTLVEGRITDHNRESIKNEMDIIGKKIINTLHITSWDQDHCSIQQIEEICKTYSPNKIEYPGYDPHTESGKQCLSFIRTYGRNQNKKIVRIDPTYIKSLDDAKSLNYSDILYHPKFLSENSNDNSTIQLFRSGSFSVLSLGDVEDHNISSFIRDKKIIKSETDVLILPHHGADNGFLTKKFLKMVKPKLAICCADFNNQFNHPKERIRNLLHESNIDLFTTKTGDVIIESIGDNKRNFSLVNLYQNSERVSSTKNYSTKRGNLFGMNSDTLKNLRRGNKRY